MEAGGLLEEGMDGGMDHSAIHYATSDRVFALPANTRSNESHSKWGVQIAAICARDAR